MSPAVLFAPALLLVATGREFTCGDCWLAPYALFSGRVFALLHRPGQLGLIVIYQRLLLFVGVLLIFAVSLVFFF
jgi:hypothetical protein